MSTSDNTENQNSLAFQILDSLTAEVALLDDSGTIIAVNDAWREFARENGGSAETTSLGVNYLEVCRSAKGEDSHEAEQAYRGIEEVIQGKRESFKLEYPCHSATKKRWFLLYVSQLKSRKRFVVTTHLSITERKLTEQRLVESERLAAIGEAMRGLSHEGRNALQRAQAGIELLELDLAGDTRALRTLKQIADAHSHLQGLYEEVTSYAAPINLSRRLYPIDKIVDEAWSSVARKGSHITNEVETNLDIDCEVDVGVMRIVLEQVFMNSLAATPYDAELQVSYLEAELNGRPAITMVISDNGSGIPQDDCERVFEPFFTTKTSGTGLGLAIAKRNVMAHGGSICFGTPLSDGASLYISLPKKRPTAVLE